MHLGIADAVFILGSTEPHYTPSKTYQGVLSEKPIFAVLHEKSTAADVVQSTGAGQTLCFNGTDGLDELEARFLSTVKSFQLFAKKFDPSDVNQNVFERFSAKLVTSKLSNLLNKL